MDPRIVITYRRHDDAPSAKRTGKEVSYDVDCGSVGTIAEEVIIASNSDSGFEYSKIGTVTFWILQIRPDRAIVHNNKAIR